MEISENLLCLFSADVREEDGEYVVDVPRREIETGSVDPGETYRVALISRSEGVDGTDGVDGAERDGASAGGGTDLSASRADDGPQPPVEPGEMRYVEIEDLGKQGDGIARVERGYVIIVPDTEVGERVKIEITEVKSNFAVGEVVDEMH
jgi:predicted RNA-binding protein with TRAM domain